MLVDDGRASRLILVSCVKTKRAMPAAAMDLYTSNWFRKARACVEKTGCPWRILSAQYGLVHPEEEIRPYEKTLSTSSKSTRCRGDPSTDAAFVELCGTGSR